MDLHISIGTVNQKERVNVHIFKHPSWFIGMSSTNGVLEHFDSCIESIDGYSKFCETSFYQQNKRDC